MKRIISLFLSTVFVFSFLTVSSFAEKKTNEDFNFAVAMGYVDAEQMGENDKLTRIKMAEILYGICVGSQFDYNAVYGESDFYDVLQEKKHIVAAMRDLSIMQGYADGSFAPDNVVTYNQLVKVIVSFLGYNLHAERLGGYPSGYLIQAAYLKLSLGNISGDEQVTVGDFAKLLKQAVNVKIATYDGDTEIRVTDKNYLEFYQGIYVSKGKVTGNYLTNMYSDKICQYDQIYFENVLMNVTKSNYSISEKIGSEVYVYYKNDGGIYTVCYYEEPDKSIIDIQGEEISYATNEKYVFYAGDSEEEAYLSSGAVLIYNGSYLGSYGNSHLNPFASGGKNGSVRLVDNNLDSVYDTVIVSAYTAVVAKNYSNGIINNYFEPSKFVDIKKYKERNIDICNVVGTPIEPEKIKEGSVVCVYTDAGGTIKKIVVCNDNLSGAISEIEKNGSKIKAAKIDGIRFEAGASLYVNDAQNKLAPGRRVKAYFGPDGKITHIDLDSFFKDDYKYGFLVDAANEGGFKPKSQVKIFSATGSMEIYDVAENITINDSLRKKAEELISYAGIDDGKVVRQAILYKIDESGKKLTSIYFADNTKGFHDGFYEFPQKNCIYRQYLRTFDGYFAPASDMVVFSVPSEADRNTDYKYQIISDIPEEINMQKIRAYGTKKSGMTSNIVVYTDTNAGEMPSKSPIMVVKDVALTYDERGELATKVEGLYVEGTTFSQGYFTIDTQTLMDAFGGKLPQPGDILRSTSLVYSKIANNVWPMFEANGEKMYTSNPSDSFSGHRYAYGKVIEKEDDSFKIRLSGAGDVTEVHSYSSYKIIECKYNKRTKSYEIALSNKDCIKDEASFAGEGSKIYFYERGGSAIAMFVYN